MPVWALMNGRARSGWPVASDRAKNDFAFCSVRNPLASNPSRRASSRKNPPPTLNPLIALYPISSDRGNSSNVVARPSSPPSAGALVTTSGNPGVGWDLANHRPKSAYDQACGAIRCIAFDGGGTCS